MAGERHFHPPPAKKMTCERKTQEEEEDEEEEEEELHTSEKNKYSICTHTAKWSNPEER
jgi:hypothetical protein